MLSALAIAYTFYIFVGRKKICSKHACRKKVANLINRGLAADRKMSAFVNKEVVSRRLGNLRIELSRC